MSQWPIDPSFLLYIGMKTAQLYRDYFISHEIRIPMNPNQDFMECHVFLLVCLVFCWFPFPNISADDPKKKSTKKIKKMAPLEIRGKTSLYQKFSGWPLVRNEGMNPHHNHVWFHSPIPYVLGEMFGCLKMLGEILGKNILVSENWGNVWVVLSPHQTQKL